MECFQSRGKQIDCRIVIVFCRTNKKSIECKASGLIRKKKSNCMSVSLNIEKKWFKRRDKNEERKWKLPKLSKKLHTQGLMCPWNLSIWELFVCYVLLLCNDVWIINAKKQQRGRRGNSCTLFWFWGFLDL